MVDSVGRSVITGKKRKISLQETVQKMEQWRDKARIKLLQQRRKYKQKFESNQALMRAKKADELKNLNPSAVLLGDKPKSRKFGITHSTIPLKPKYSTVKPAERIYGNKWKELERRRKK